MRALPLYKIALEEQPRARSSKKPLPAIPSPLASLYSHFPLVLLPPLQSTTPAPSPSRIWALGPPPQGHTESLDPLCRALQAHARFAQVETQREVKWVGWDGRESAPGGVLPAVHTGEGDLLVGEEVDAWVVKQQQQQAAKKDGGKRTSGGGEFGAPEPPSSSPTPQQDPTHQAYTALVETTLLPAVLAALYLSPAGTAPPVVPSRPKPLLSALAESVLSWNERTVRIEEVKRLRGGKVGKKTVLDLEEIEREAADAIEALEVKVKEVPGEWFGGVSSPTRLDALLYALLSIIRVLPPAADPILRQTLERCRALVDWVKRHDP
ncbi:hypothetical protein JCM6882_003344 [Rhodosporidiobolus microsporus]